MCLRFTVVLKNDLNPAPRPTDSQYFRGLDIFIINLFHSGEHTMYFRLVNPKPSPYNSGPYPLILKIGVISKLRLNYLVGRFLFCASYIFQNMFVTSFIFCLFIDISLDIVNIYLVSYK